MSSRDLRVNPYVGLRPFFVEDSLYFYGRDEQTAELLAILRDNRFLSVVGSSGSGKSSLVRAGLLPALRGGFLVGDRDRWHTVQIRPGDAPIANLAQGLCAALTSSSDGADALARAIRDDHTEAILRFLKTHLDDRSSVFLLVDQFEEIFAFRGAEEIDGGPGDVTHRRKRSRRRDEAADYVDLLIQLAEHRDLPIYVALTMRTDFLGECDLFYGLPEALNRGRYLVPRLTREQLRDAVQCPALLLGAKMSPRLLDHVLNELGDRSDRLPMLQHALLRTWDAWSADGRRGPIDLRHYQTAGGIDGALNEDAEGALAGLDREAVARIFKRLTDTDLSDRRVRSPARMSELEAATGLPRATIEQIVTRFIEGGRNFVHRAPDGEEGNPRIDISHESLIRQWTSLKTWVDEERESRDRYLDLAARADNWDQEKAGLLQDPELKDFFDWRSRTQPSAGWAARYSDRQDVFPLANRYLDESVLARSRKLAEVELSRRWNRWWAPVVAVLSIALFAGLQPTTLSDVRSEITTPPPETVIVRGVTWTTDDRHQTVNWVDASQYCEGLSLPLIAGGDPFEYWYLPSRAELLDLQSPKPDGIGRRLRPEFQKAVSADLLWSYEPDHDAPGRHFAADFRRAVITPVPSSEAGAATALCVALRRDTAGILEAGRANQSDSSRGRDWWSLLWSLVSLGLLLTVYYVLATAGRWLQRRLTFEAIVQRFVRAGGRAPADKKAGSKADAVQIHHTVHYASSFRRAAAGSVDLLIGIMVFFALLALLPETPSRVVVTKPDGTRVEGKLIERDGPTVSLRTDAGETLSFTADPALDTSVIPAASGQSISTALPSGTQVNSHAFASSMLRVPEPTGEVWFGVNDEAASTDSAMVLRYTLDQWRQTRDTVHRDLQWRFSGDQEQVEAGIEKWTSDNPAPAPGATAEKQLLRQGLEISDTAPASGTTNYLIVAASFLALWLFQVWQVCSVHRGSIGTQLWGLVRTDLGGERMTFAGATLLSIYRIGSLLTFGLGFAVQPFTQRWQTLHDRLAGSVVLRRPVEGVQHPKPSKVASRLFSTVGIVIVLAAVGGVANLAIQEQTFDAAESPSPWVPYWDELGTFFTVKELTINDQRVSQYDQHAATPTTVVPSGKAATFRLDASIDSLRLDRCPEGACPIEFVYGVDQLREPRASSVLGTSPCDEPVLSGSIGEFLLPYRLTASIPPLAPGRYALWIDFRKLLDCGTNQPASEDRATMATFEVK